MSSEGNAIGRAVCAALAVCSLCVAVGCDAGRAFIATPNDYADYRRARLAGSFDERLAASWRYLRDRPDGRYAASMRREFEAAEAVYFKARGQTVAGLEAYLAALPDGPHAPDALAALIAKRTDTRREALAERAAHAMMRKIDAEEKGRQGVAGLCEWWVRALLDPAPWHGTFSDAPAELLARFRMTAPQPECKKDEDGEACQKVITRAFRVRHASGEVDRRLAMTVEIWLDPEYHLQRATLSGLLALRSHEAASGEASEGSAKDVKAAWRELIDRLNKAVIADSRICNGSEDDTGTLALRCEDPAVTLTVVPGSGELPDSIHIVRVKPQP